MKLAAHTQPEADSGLQAELEGMKLAAHTQPEADSGLQAVIKERDQQILQLKVEVAHAADQHNREIEGMRAKLAEHEERHRRGEGDMAAMADLQAQLRSRASEIERLHSEIRAGAAEVERLKCETR